MDIDFPDLKITIVLVLYELFYQLNFICTVVPMIDIYEFLSGERARLNFVKFVEFQILFTLQLCWAQVRTKRLSSGSQEDCLCTYRKETGNGSRHCLPCFKSETSLLSKSTIYFVLLAKLSRISSFHISSYRVLAMTFLALSPGTNMILAMEILIIQFRIYENS